MVRRVRGVRAAPTGAVVALALVAAGCGAADGGASDDGRVVVFAAASLADAFTALEARLEADDPDLDVVLNLAGSQTLVAQLREGASADVVAPADPDRLAQLDDLVGDPQVLATNGLAIAVAPGNPHGVTGLADLAAPDLVVVLPAAQVPAGAYARRALDAAGVELTPSSLELDVRAALSKVVLGEADAAVVYRSDVAAAGDAVAAVPLPPEHDVRATYPIAVLRDAPNPAGARAFVDAALSPEGRDVLAAQGFGPP